MSDRVPTCFPTSARSQPRPALPAIYEPVDPEPVKLRRSGSMSTPHRPARDVVVEIRPRPSRQEPSPAVEMRSIGTQASAESLRLHAESSARASTIASTSKSVAVHTEPEAESGACSAAHSHDEYGLSVRSPSEAGLSSVPSKTLSPAHSLDSVAWSSADGRRLASFDALRLSAPDLDVQIHTGGVASCSSSVRGGIPLSDRRARAKALGASGEDTFDAMTASMMSDSGPPEPPSRTRDISKSPSFGSDVSHDTSSKAASSFGSAAVPTIIETSRTSSTSEEEAYIAMKRAEEEERFEKQRHPAPADEPLHVIFNPGKRSDGLRSANAIAEMVKWVTSSGHSKTGAHKNLPKEVIKTVVTTTTVVELASRAMMGPTSTSRGSSGRDSASTNTDGEAGYVEPETTPAYESTVSPKYAKQTPR